ncbi:hypothetical protein VIN7_8995 [Saccharomyces cerevisiae x Saccharomyces kudriavzevii VIN7]|uniref:Uncharacterized protein n=1 Tax=Saccharomyces cerevisiae x Saccharomyces kudriavzevii (strain VIN7) TaxID=1095631 RepID=H0GYY6_SACCK|nr:hypothetical protein VIN7_8995 [Saccharomyces cerevisiae x Saccharomyces kudriavzevii VIN7]
MPEDIFSEPFKSKYRSRFAVSARFVPFLRCSQASEKGPAFTHSTVLMVNDGLAVVYQQGLLFCVFLIRHRSKNLDISFRCRLVQGPFLLAERRHPPRIANTNDSKTTIKRSGCPSSMWMPRMHMQAVASPNVLVLTAFAAAATIKSGKPCSYYPTAARCRLTKFRNENLMKKLPLTSAKVV